MISLLESILDMIADIVDATSTDIATSTLQLMSTLLHLGPVLVGEALSHLLDALIQRHLL